MSTEPVFSPSPIVGGAPLSDMTVVAGFRTADFRGDGEELLRTPDALFSIPLPLKQLRRWQEVYTHVLDRDPTRGELCILGAIYTEGAYRCNRLGVGELYTDSPAIAETWADMMHRHTALHEALSLPNGMPFGRQSGKRVIPPPPCTFEDMAALVSRYLRRTAPPKGGEETVITISPLQEMEAAVEGYRPVAAVLDDRGCKHDRGCKRTVWTRHTAPERGRPPRTGDILLLVRHMDPASVMAFFSRVRHLSASELGDMRAITRRSLLLTLTELCEGADLYVDRLASTGEELPFRTLPIKQLCGLPSTEAVEADCLLRIPAKRAFSIMDQLQKLGHSSITIGQVRTDDRMVFRWQDTPMSELPSPFLREAANIRLRRFTPEAHAEPAAVYASKVCRLPCPMPKENGILPEGHEVVALTVAPEVLSIPEAQLLLHTVHADVEVRGQGYATARRAVELALAPLVAGNGFDSRKTGLSVSLSPGSADGTADDRTLEVLCGLYRATAERGIGMDDLAFSEAASAEHTALRLSVTAWTQAPATGVKKPAAADSETHGKAPRFLFPVLHPSCEPGLRAVSATLNRACGASCRLHPLVIRQIAQNNAVPQPPEFSPNIQWPPREQEPSKEAMRDALDPASAEKLIASMSEGVIPLFAMSEADAHLLLELPHVRAALEQVMASGCPILVLGSACCAFAAYGYLPEELQTLSEITPMESIAHVEYACPASGPHVQASRLLRCRLLAPANTSSPHLVRHPARHLMRLIFPDGAVIPDGFVGSKGRMLGLLNGLDAVSAGFCFRLPFQTFDVTL